MCAHVQQKTSTYTHITYKHLKLEKAQIPNNIKMDDKLWNTQTIEHYTSVKMNQLDLPKR